jgi:hypothetical protein
MQNPRGPAKLLSMQDSSGHPKPYAAFKPRDFGAIFANNPATVAGFEAATLALGCCTFLALGMSLGAHIRLPPCARGRSGALSAAARRRSPPHDRDLELPLLDDKWTARSTHSVSVGSLPPPRAWQRVA